MVVSHWLKASSFADMGVLSELNMHLVQIEKLKEDVTGARVAARAE